MDRRVKLRHFQTFIEIARQGSLKQAAEKLNLTQPAMSKTLREFEVILGVRLMRRGRAGASLTREGEFLLQFAETGLSALEQGISGVSAAAGGGQSRISVGALPSVAARLLPLAARHFADLSPQTTLFFQDGPHGYLVDRLRRRELDVVVGRLGPADTMSAVSFTQLYKEKVVLVVRPGHPLLDGCSLADIVDWPVIYPSQNSAIRPLVDRLLIANGVGKIANRTEAVSGAFGRTQTRSSDSVWFISEGVVAADVDAGSLAKLDLDTDLTAGPVGIMMRAEEDPSPVVRLFRKAIHNALEELHL